MSKPANFAILLPFVLFNVKSPLFMTIPPCPKSRSELSVISEPFALLNIFIFILY